MSGDGFTYKDLMQVVDLVEKSASFAEFHLKIGDIEVHIENRGNPRAAVVEASAVRQIDTGAGAAAAEQPAASAHAVKQIVPAQGLALVKSPMVGTFYRAPEPGAPPFVAIGSRVTPDTTVCIVEVMKLMNSLRAGVAGVVVDIAVQDADPVEFGQVLVAIDTTQ